jgi:hypothetical protein
MAGDLRLRAEMKTVFIFPTFRRFRKTQEHDARTQHHRSPDDN